MSSDPLFVCRTNPAAVLPARQTPGSAGYDLSSAEDVTVPPRNKAVIPLGIAIAIPSEHYGRIAPRSGLATKHNIDVGAGVIDSDYRGSLCVLLFNHSDVPFDVKRGDRIAQLIIERISTPNVVEVTSTGQLSVTTRGSQGFGSTGVSSNSTTKGE